MKNETQAKVTARNRVNTQVNEIAPKLLEILKPFVGKKVIVGGNNLSAKLAEALDPFLGWQKIHSNLQIFRNVSNYSLSFVFKISEMDSENSCVYQEEYVYLGDLELNNLKSLADFTPRKTDFNLAEVESVREELTKLEAKISELNSKLNHFGRY
jgi:hypothetical protein